MEKWAVTVCEVGVKRRGVGGAATLPSGDLGSDPIKVSKYNVCANAILGHISMLMTNVRSLMYAMHYMIVVRPTGFKLLNETPLISQIF